MECVKDNSGWHSNCVHVEGILSDITGVLYDGGDGDGTPIPGSIEAVNKLKSAGIPLRFCTNETQHTKDGIAAKLQRLGFDISPGEIFAPAPATRNMIQQHGLRPHLLVHPGVLAEFKDINTTEPNCVVLGDAAQEFSYDNMNTAFQVLIGLKEPKLISMGAGKYYKDGSELKMDVGAYCAALEYSCGVKADIIGKPAAEFFKQAIRDIGITPDKALMIGDDIVSDVGGAQACGLMGIQVRTGKYRPSDEPHHTVKPDGYVNDLAQFVDIFLENRTPLCHHD